MKLRFFKFVPTAIVDTDKTALIGINNPGAILTIDGKMVIHPENKTLEISEIETITQLLTKIK